MSYDYWSTQKRQSYKVVIEIVGYRFRAGINLERVYDLQLKGVSKTKTALHKLLTPRVCLFVCLG